MNASIVIVDCTLTNKRAQQQQSETKTITCALHTRTMNTLLALLLFLVLLDAVVPVASSGTSTCKYTRKQCAECAERYVDADGDGAICREEITQALDAVVGPFESLVELWYTPDYVMRQCDWDHDGFITMKDFEGSERDCLHTCTARTILFETVCDRLAALKHPLPRVACKRKH